MKKSFFILFAVFLMQTAYSQTEKGKMFIGGQLSLTRNTNSVLDSLISIDNNTGGFSISPDFGYFIKDNLAIGATLSFETSDQTQNYNDYQFSSSTKTINKYIQI